MKLCSFDFRGYKIHVPARGMAASSLTYAKSLVYVSLCAGRVESSAAKEEPGLKKQLIFLLECNLLERLSQEFNEYFRCKKE